MIEFGRIFKGYYEREDVRISDDNGVYFVYAGKKTYGQPSLRRLIYIGESENIQERIRTHEKHDEWLTYLHQGEMLLFSCTSGKLSNLEDRNRVEASYIYEHNPPVNKEYKENFPFESTSIISNGDIGLLKGRFLIKGYSKK